VGGSERSPADFYFRARTAEHRVRNTEHPVRNAELRGWLPTRAACVVNQLAPTSNDARFL
jgi:hypothetical protein